MLSATFALAAATEPALPSIGAISLSVLIGVIVLSLVFDFLNGFHDAANSIATIVSTRVLTPGQAVLWAAFFNFVAAFFFGTAVANTIATGLVDPAMIDINVVTAGVVGAIVWNIITWLLGLPTSSSHALFGAVAGAAVIKSGFNVLVASGWTKIIIGIVLAPTLGLILGSAMVVLTAWVFRRQTPHRVDRLFRRLQLASAALYSLGHGGNDAQKTMGIIVIALGAAGQAHWAKQDPGFLAPLHAWASKMPFQHNIAWWIILLCHTAIALGTCFGGWRIVKTMGTGITRLTPVGGFCAETSAAIAITGFTKIGGVPISTTHAITGAILGVGATTRVRSVRWIWGQRIVMAWILTIPCSAFVAAVAYLLIRNFCPLY